MYILRLSNIHASLPFAELRAIIDAEGIEYRNMIKLDEFVILDIDEESLKTISYRAALIREYGELIEVYNSINELDIQSLISLAMYFSSSIILFSKINTW